MKRSLLVSVLALALGGCAAVSGSPARPGASYDTMASTPPEPRKEDVPQLSARQVWVPGYYQPVAGAWVWHQGEVREAKPGYRLVPASYREENGRIAFYAPRWRRSDLTATATAAK